MPLSCGHNMSRIADAANVWKNVSLRNTYLLERISLSLFRSRMNSSGVSIIRSDSVYAMGNIEDYAMLSKENL